MTIGAVTHVFFCASCGQEESIYENLSLKKHYRGGRVCRGDIFSRDYQIINEELVSSYDTSESKDGVQ